LSAVVGDQTEGTEFDDNDFAALRILQLKGMAPVVLLSAATVDWLSDFAQRLERLQLVGYVEHLPRGTRVTATGRAWLAARLEQEREASDASLCRQLYESFTPVNRRFKQLIFDWQMRVVAGSEVPNDHTDAAYDEAIIARLTELHETLVPVLDRAATVALRLKHYPGRFVRALRRAVAGERRYIAAPLIDSYHTIWFELHEDLLSVAGLGRAEEARAGRAD
jgi:pyruvate,orthophosphate dikinase